ncbi:MAG: hypothetical protein QOJ19_2966, partial [Acidimicrobiia bacterium]|nr:hypothetical protein [Acidimicrobiia bacterium]
MPQVSLRGAKMTKSRVFFGGMLAVL